MSDDRWWVCDGRPLDLRTLTLDESGRMAYVTVRLNGDESERDIVKWAETLVVMVSNHLHGQGSRFLDNPIVISREVDRDGSEVIFAREVRRA